MKKKDLRSLDHRQLETIRKTAVKLSLEKIMSDKKVAEIMWTTPQSICYWKSAYEEWWRKALVAKEDKWGRPKDEKKNLTAKEMKKLDKLLCCEPREHKQLRLDFWLRTIKVIIELIKVKFDKKLKFWKVREILIDLWFSNQKPLFRAYQSDPEKIIKWVKEELPFIQYEAKKEWREICYWDEAWFRSTDQKGKTRWKKWITPIVKVTWARFCMNAISIISSRWELRFMTYKWSFSSDTLLQFLRRLVSKTTKKYTLILDGHSTHKTKKVKKYLEEIDNQIKLYYLPWYSPRLNPDEQVRNHVENDLKGRIIRSEKAMTEKVLQSLYSLQKQPMRVKSFFNHPEVQFS